VVSAVFGLHGLPLPSRKSPRASLAEDPQVTPTVLAKTYEITGASVPSGSTQNRQAVAEFQGQYMKNTDLQKFFKAYVPHAKASDATVAKFVGDKIKQQGMVEGSLDIQYIMGNNAGLKTEYWYFNEQDFCAALANWSATIIETKSPPLVHSVSYGVQSSVGDLQCDPAKVRAIESNLAKIAAMGITIVFASGDEGSGYDPDPPNLCIDVDSNKKKYPHGTGYTGTVVKVLKGLNYADPASCCDTFAATYPKVVAWSWKKGPWSKKEKSPTGTCTGYSKVTGTIKDPTLVSHASGIAHMFPSWPSTSPWVTAVGATTFAGGKVGNEEVATHQFGSGGGFSDMFNRSEHATWQDAAVAKYFSSFPASAFPPSNRYARYGRATPDVAALGVGYMVFASTSGKQAQPVSGTSASAPFFAGLVSLLNEARIQRGGKPMGFLNPWIYNHTEAFTDITKGVNNLDDAGDRTRFGWNCTTGWDPVTGVGTPIFSKMLQAALSN